VKHGFNGRDRGTVCIRLDLDTANRYALTIKADGNGLTSDADLKGLGSSIMQSLAAQLIIIGRFEGKKLVEDRVEYDRYNLLRQLGVH
jgi:two-component sensor histidine kinase